MDTSEMYIEETDGKDISEEGDFEENEGWWNMLMKTAGKDYSVTGN